MAIRQMRAMYLNESKYNPSPKVQKGGWGGAPITPPV
jgi:hypothetical protein